MRQPRRASSVRDDACRMISTLPRSRTRDAAFAPMRNGLTSARSALERLREEYATDGESDPPLCHRGTTMRSSKPNGPNTLAPVATATPARSVHTLAKRMEGTTRAGKPALASSHTRDSQADEGGRFLHSANIDGGSATPFPCLASARRRNATLGRGCEATIRAKVGGRAANPVFPCAPLWCDGGI